jgi:hypothetical protein
VTTTHVKADLVAYVSGDLDEAASWRVRKHLATCAACRKEYEAVHTLWADLGRIPDQPPAPSVARSFHAMLDSYETGVRRPAAGPARRRAGSRLERLLFGRPALQLGAGVAVLAIGIGLGYAGRGIPGGGDQLGQLREEVSELRNLLALSLLQQESASDRLKGVSWTSDLEATGPGITAALTDVMMHDRNVNVRLAALNALARNMAAPEVRRDILLALPGQKSPLMQLALVDALVQINDRESREVLQRALNRPDLRPEVRQRIQQGIKLIL